MAIRTIIEIPKEFYKEWRADCFGDVLSRLKNDAHCLAGEREIEIAEMLSNALEHADDAPPVWHVNDHGCFYCSSCGFKLIDAIDYDEIDDYLYCPSCGSKMGKY